MHECNTEHQMIDDISTDIISYGIRALETMCFAYCRIKCLIVLSSLPMTVSLSNDMLSYIA